MRLIIEWIFVVLLAVNLATAVSAQGTATGTCEVAVWTAPDYRADNLGLMIGGALGSVFTEPNLPHLNSKDALRQILSANDLFAIVESSKLSEILNSNIIYRHVAADSNASKVDQKKDGRSTLSSNKCYIEIYFDIIYYQSSTVYGSRIFDYLTIRDFRGDRVIRSSGYQSDRMANFSKQSAESGTSMMRDAVKTAFNSLVEKKLAVVR
jgi:hypothetical protein